ncbi:NAD(P)-dependent oxidoreductase [bacterium]|nr:NAD(P)-dependent oxidoreductase [bacterium]
MNVLYPIFLKLKDKPVIVVGGGKVAYRKLKSLLDAGAKITVVSPELDQNLRDLVEGDRINRITSHENLIYFCLLRRQHNSFILSTNAVVTLHAVFQQLGVASLSRNRCPLGWSLAPR